MINAISYVAIGLALVAGVVTAVGVRRASASVRRLGTLLSLGVMALYVGNIIDLKHKPSFNFSACATNPCWIYRRGFLPMPGQLPDSVSDFVVDALLIVAAAAVGYVFAMQHRTRPQPHHPEPSA